MRMRLNPIEAVRGEEAVAVKYLRKTLSTARAWLVLAALLAGMRPHFCAAETGTVSNQLAITSMAMQGTNLLLSASFPPGLEKLTLETRSALDAPWEEAEQQTAAAGGGEMTFIFPQTADEARFFRLRGSPIIATPQTPQLVSVEMKFVVTASLGSRLSNGNAVFHFKGKVDGSDRILITHEGALWDHVNWGYPPEPISINGTQWNPARKNYLSSVGPMPFLPETFSLESVDLDVIKGRDVVALERTNNGLIVYLDDTPGGPGQYEFNINFHPAAPKLPEARPSTVARIKISALVDGSDCIKITAREAVLVHNAFRLPSNLSVNGVPWDATKETVLKNEGATRFLPDGVDFSTARIASRKGRDLATAWGEKDALWVCFADNPNGRDAYEIEIAFGPEHTER